MLDEQRDAAAVSRQGGAVTVYVVERCFDYEGCNMLAVFSTQELADAYVEKEKLYPTDESISIVPWEVDGMVTTSASPERRSTPAKNEDNNHG